MAFIILWNHGSLYYHTVQNARIQNRGQPEFVCDYRRWPLWKDLSGWECASIPAFWTLACAGLDQIAKILSGQSNRTFIQFMYRVYPIYDRKRLSTDGWCIVQLMWNDNRPYGLFDSDMGLLSPNDYDLRYEVSKIVIKAVKWGIFKGLSKLLLDFYATTINHFYLDISTAYTYDYFNNSLMIVLECHIHNRFCGCGSRGISDFYERRRG